MQRSNMSRRPIDRGWAWMICVGTGVQAFFVIGGLKCMGILFVEIIEIFGASRSVTSLTLGLVAGGFAVFAMMCNALSMVFGMRVLTVFGGSLFALSLFLAMFPVNIWYTVMMLGLVSGIALGAMLTPAILVLNVYFNKRKSFANGLALAGSSIGQMILPYLMTFLIKEFGFQGAMLIYSAIALHTVPAAMLLRPIQFWDYKRPVRSLSAGDIHATDGQIRNSASNATTPQSTHKQLSPTDIHSSQSSVLKSAAISLAPGVSVESLNIIKSQVDNEQGHKTEGWKVCCIRVKPITAKAFCSVIFDGELLRSPCLWLLFFALGLGHAGFINALLHLPSLAVELFNDKSIGALLVTVVGGFDLCGRVGGGWFSDQGYLSRGSIILLGFTVSGTATILVVFYPTLPCLLVYCFIMGMIGGLYRILLPVIVGDLFGSHKTGTGVGMLFMSLGLLIIPFPTILGYMRQVLGTYRPSFQLCGALLLLGALLMGILLFVKKYDKAVVKPQVTPEVNIDDDETESPDVREEEKKIALHEHV